MKEIRQPNVAGELVVLTGVGAEIRFDFDRSDATFDREDGGLVISFENGSKVTIEDFFVVAEGAKLPELILDDGTKVHSEDFLKAIDADFNVSPALGPSVSSSGIGSYQDEAGNLVSGVDSLGDQASMQWSRFTTTAAAKGIIENASLNDAGTGGGNSDGGVTPPAGNSADYHVRVVLGDTALEDGVSSGFFIVDADGNKVTDPFGWAEPELRRTIF